MPRVTILMTVIVIEDDDEDSLATVETPRPEPPAVQEAFDQLASHLLTEMRRGRDCSPFSTLN